MFYNQEYANLSDALEVPNAVTVVGVLFEVSLTKDTI